MILVFQGAVLGMIAGNGVTIWILVGTFLRGDELRENALKSAAAQGTLETFTEGCESVRGLDSSDIAGLLANRTRTEREFFYVPDG